MLGSRSEHRCMRSVIVLCLLSCGSNDGVSSGTPGNSSSMAPAAMQSTASAMAAANMRATESPVTAAIETPSAPVVIPEALRESHDRLVAAVEADPQDVSSACSLASVLRRAEDLAGANAVLNVAIETATAHPAPELLPGTLEACHYELGRVAEAQDDFSSARESYWAATKTPIERRRNIVVDAYFRATEKMLEQDGCDSVGGAIGLRGLLTLRDAPAFRRCLRNVERETAVCGVVERGTPEHPGRAPSNYDEHRVVGERAFGLIANELYIIGERGIRRCEFDLAEGSFLSSPRELRIGDTTLLYMHSNANLSYACDCDEEPQGNCRCTDSFNAHFIFSERGEFRLALVDDYSTDDGMPGATWDAPELRVPVGGAVEVRDEQLRIGRTLALRNGAFVPASD